MKTKTVRAMATLAAHLHRDMDLAEVQCFCDLDKAGCNLMRASMQQLNLSAIVDLAGEGEIQVQHLAEAL